jgi:hypothetical protein
MKTKRFYNVIAKWWKSDADKGTTEMCFDRKKDAYQAIAFLKKQGNTVHVEICTHFFEILPGGIEGKAVLFTDEIYWDWNHLEQHWEKTEF